MPYVVSCVVDIHYVIHISIMKPLINTDQMDLTTSPVLFPSCAAFCDQRRLPTASGSVSLASSFSVSSPLSSLKIIIN